MPEQVEQPAPKVDGPIGNSAIGIGYAIGKLATAVGGDNGIRLMALAFVGSVTWVATWSVQRYTEMQGGTDSLIIRVGEDRVEREKSDRARAEKDMRDWMSSEMEKARADYSKNLSFLTREFASENERNRAMVFKLAGTSLPAKPMPPPDDPDCEWP